MRLSFTQEADFRQERDFGQKISATFEFMRAHWRPLGRVLLYLVVPATLLQHILAAAVQLRLHTELRGAIHSSVAGQRPGLGTVLSMQKAMWFTLFGSPTYWINSLLGTVVTSLLILSIYGYVTQLLYRRTPGADVTVADVWTVVRRHFLGTFFSLLGLGLLVGAGFVFLFIPGLYLGVALSIFFIVKQSEGSGFWATVRRSLSLTRGKWWSTFGLLFIMLMILYVVVLGIGLTATMLSGGFMALLHSSREHSPVFTVIASSVNALLLLLLYPPLLLVLAFQYFNLVERKDGLGLRHLLNSLGQTPAPQVSNATYRPDEEGEY